MTRDKIKDVLSSILGTAVRYQLLVKNPIEGVQLPPKRRGKRIAKPNITSEQFDQILAGIPEPYATMVRGVFGAPSKRADWAAVERCRDRLPYGR